MAGESRETARNDCRFTDSLQAEHAASLDDDVVKIS